MDVQAATASIEPQLELLHYYKATVTQPYMRIQLLLRRPGPYYNAAYRSSHLSCPCTWILILFEGEASPNAERAFG